MGRKLLSGGDKGSIRESNQGRGTFPRRRVLINTVCQRHGKETGIRGGAQRMCAYLIENKGMAMTWRQFLLPVCN
jgi:hypothetical protein